MVNECVFISILKKKITGITMILTKDFKETVAKRIDRDPEFTKTLFYEAVSLFLN